MGLSVPFAGYLMKGVRVPPCAASVLLEWPA
jgi:hypothetical protein